MNWLSSYDMTREQATFKQKRTVLPLATAAGTVSPPHMRIMLYGSIWE